MTAQGSDPSDGDTSESLSNRWDATRNNGQRLENLDQKQQLHQRLDATVNLLTRKEMIAFAKCKLRIVS